MTSARHESWPWLYQIRVRGRLGQTIRSAFPALRTRVDGGDTVLTGVLADQAALYGVLAEAEALGLELIEVRRLPPDEPQEPSEETRSERHATVSEGDAVTCPRIRESGLRTSTEPGIPLFMNVTLTIKPERLEEYLAALSEVLPAARAEPGCIYLHVGQSMTEPGVFVLSEGWQDRVEYRDTILQKPYYQAYMRVSESTYARPRRVVLLTPVD